MRRGRPPHADILTPRQWQVLELLQEGLTNEQIGERLGVTADGAKYHVAEIISKLGVSSRGEAVDWYRRGAPKPWWHPARALLPLRPLAGRWLPATVVVAALLLLGIFAVAVLTSREGGGDERSAFVDSIGSRAENAGQDGGYRDGAASQALFNQPAGVAADRDGNVYVADQSNNKLRKIAPDGTVSTIEGPGEIRLVASPGPGVPTPSPEESSGLFFAPTTLATDTAGNVYVAGINESVVYQVTPDGEATAIAGDPDPQVPDLSPLEGPWAPYRNLPLLGDAGDVFVRGTTGLAAGDDGSVYMVGDQIDVLAGRNQMVRRLTPEGQVVLVAGAEQAGYRDGPGAEARFDNPVDIAIDRHGNLFVADNGNRRVRKVTPDGTVTTIAGSGETGLKDGPALEARFTSIASIAVGQDDTIYVADSTAIRMITTSGEVRTLAGAGSGVSLIQLGMRDGPGPLARFQSPLDLAVAPNGDVYASDFGNNAIRRLSFQTGTPAAVTATPPAGYRASFSQGEILTVMAYDGHEDAGETPLCIDIVERIVTLQDASIADAETAECNTGGLSSFASFGRYILVQGEQGLYLLGSEVFLLTAQPPPPLPTPSGSDEEQLTNYLPLCSEIRDRLLPGDRPIPEEFSNTLCVARAPSRNAAAQTFSVWAYVPVQGDVPIVAPPNGAQPPSQPATTPTPLPAPDSLPGETPCFALGRYYGLGGGEGGTAEHVRCVLPE